eukprot:Gb_25778 [translate_table: standard]
MLQLWRSQISMGMIVMMRIQTTYQWKISCRRWVCLADYSVSLLKAGSALTMNLASLAVQYKNLVFECLQKARRFQLNRDDRNPNQGPGFKHPTVMLATADFALVFCGWILIEGKLAPRASTFSSGIKALSDYVHSRGLKLGIYSDVG